jgi:hypothetical protein
MLDNVGTHRVIQRFIDTIAQILKSIQIFKVHGVLFILMGAIANPDEFYPPEEKIRTEFIKKVEAAERRVREGKFTQYTPEEFEKSYL